MLKDLCESTHINNIDQVNIHRESIREKNFVDTAGLFKALSDPTRIKIAYILTLEELCVCDVASIAEVSTATASHHLRLLRDLGLAAYRKQGKLAFYSINNETIKELLQITVDGKEGE